MERHHRAIYFFALRKAPVCILCPFQFKSVTNIREMRAVLVIQVNSKSLKLHFSCGGSSVSIITERLEEFKRLRHFLITSIYQQSWNYLYGTATLKMHMQNETSF